MLQGLGIHLSDRALAYHMQGAGLDSQNHIHTQTKTNCYNQKQAKDTSWEIFFSPSGIDISNDV
jgi:LPS sulfotransferase NodH